MRDDAGRHAIGNASSRRDIGYLQNIGLQGMNWPVTPPCVTPLTISVNMITAVQCVSTDIGHGESVLYPVQTIDDSISFQLNRRSIAAELMEALSVFQLPLNVETLITVER